MSGSRGIIAGLVVIAMAFLLTALSISWVQSGECQPGNCNPGDIGGGFPLTALWEYPGGYSPLGGNGALDIEDAMYGGLDLLGLALDTIFFGLFLLLVRWAIVRARGGTQEGALLALGAPLALLLLGGVIHSLDLIPTPLERDEAAWRAAVRPEQAALVGEWAATSEAGRAFTLLLERDGKALLIFPAMVFAGEYLWEEGRIELRLRSDVVPVLEPTLGLCSLAPAMLAAACTSELKIYDPAAYPAPPQAAIPYPEPGGGAGAPYPAPPSPTPPPVVADRLVIRLTVAVTGETLTLTSPAGDVLSLRRTTGTPR